MKLGVVQFNAIDHESVNLAKLEALIRKGAADGCRLIVLPEVAYYRGMSNDNAPDKLPGRASAFISALAVELGIWIHGGTFAEFVTGAETGPRQSAGPSVPAPECFNTSFLVNPRGEIGAAYRKIHLFDVDLPGLRLMESDTFSRGAAIVAAKVDDFTVGMLICYDLRFPGIWMALRARGAQLFVLPVNFTKTTGEAHWEVLLRARAIETQSYVAASAQWGPHPHKNFSAYGRSMIIDPWGRIIAEAPVEGDTVITAEIDVEVVEDVRRRMPVHAHRRTEMY